MRNASNTSTDVDIMFGCHGDSVGIPHETERMVTAVVMLVIIIVALMGNCLVVVVITRCKSLRETSYVFLCSLAVSDMLAPFGRILFIAIANIQGDFNFTSQDVKKA